jgi:predicted nuclease of restriction endonuclease-like RecB superfamily
MSPDIARPFESIESAHEFIVLLEESIAEAIADVQAHLQSAEPAASDERQTRALNLALFKLNQLSTQMHKSRRALNDLRTIRRLLFTERSMTEGA